MKKGKKILIGVALVVIIVIIVCLVYFKTTIISKSEVKRIILNDMNLTTSDVYFDDIDLELDKEYYEVDLYYNNQEYTYKINYKTGAIIHTDFKLESTNSENNTNIDNTSYLTLEEVKKIALDYVGIYESNVIFKETKQDYENGILVYDIEFIYKNYEYELEINASNGKIIEYNKELNR